MTKKRQFLELFNYSGRLIALQVMPYTVVIVLIARGQTKH